MAVVYRGMTRSKTHYQDMPDLRRRAVELSANGAGPSAICRELSVARSTVWRWLKLNEGAQTEALDKPMGRPRRLSDSDRASIVEALLRGPEANGFETQLWTLRRIAEVIRRVTGVSYNSNYVSRLLGSMGWTCQKPERRARERDEDAIGNWVRQEWPLIKKKDTTWAPR